MLPRGGRSLARRFPSTRAQSPFAPFLASPSGVCVLDGGLTTALPNEAEQHFLWGHQLLFGEDGGLEVLKGVHRAFLDSGADCIGSQTYKLSHEMIFLCGERGMLADLRNSEAVTTEELYSRAIQTADGASLVGGCCRVQPHQISEFRAALG